MKALDVVFRSTWVAALGGLLFGFDTAVISGTTGALERVFGLSAAALGFTVASALVGTVVGSVLVGRPSDTFGRRVVLALMGVFYAVSAVGCGLAWDWWSLVAFRFLGGIGVGGSSVVSPMYIAEISPARIRGRLVAVQQFNVCLGICLAYVSNFVVASVPWISEAHQWRWMFAVEAVPAVAFTALLFGIPESPRWLVRRRRLEDARRVLVALRGENVDLELGEIVASMDRPHEGRESVFSRKYRFPVTAAVMLALFNQLTGINALLYYAPKVFTMGHSSASAALLQSIPVGIMLVVSTTLGMVLIDRAGRKLLLMVGSVGMSVFLGAVAAQFLTLSADADIGRRIMWFFVGYILFFGFSQGAVIWVFISEIFPNRVRAEGQALGSFTHWLAATVVSQAFPIAVDSPWIGPGRAFLFFAVMMALHFVFVWLLLPETKGVSLEKIQTQLGID
jgi:sugar porter (SP) family MFS transporter